MLIFDIMLGLEPIYYLLLQSIPGRGAGQLLGASTMDNIPHP